MWTCAALLLFFSDPTAHVQSLITSGKLSEALTEVRRLLTGRPEDPALLNFFGIIEAQRGNTAAAEASFRKALLRVPASISIRANLARIQQQSGQVKEAAENWAAVVGQDPGNQEARYQLAWIAVNQGDNIVALRHLVRLSPAAQQKPQALAIRVAAGASPEALDALGSHAGLSEADVLGIVPILRKARRTDTLLSLLRRLQARGLAGRSSLETLAAVYEDQQRYGEARKALEQVAERIGRADVPLLLALARMSWQEHDYKGTLSYLGQARHLQPEHAGVHFFFGMTAVSLDLPIEAKKSLARALELDPGNEYAHYAYGAVLAQERDASPSIPHFQAYAAKRPEDARGKFALAVAYFLSNQFEDAKTRLAPLTADPKTAAGAHYFLGRIARRQEDLTEAEKQLQASVALRSDQPDVHAELGYVYMRLGRMELARKELQRALSIDRDHYQANTHLLVLYQRLKDPRAGGQASVLDKIKEKRSVQERSLWQTIEIRPW